MRKITLMPAISKFSDLKNNDDLYIPANPVIWHCFHLNVNKHLRIPYSAPFIKRHCICRQNEVDSASESFSEL